MSAALADPPAVDDPQVDDEPKGDEPKGDDAPKGDGAGKTTQPKDEPGDAERALTPYVVLASGEYFAWEGFEPLAEGGDQKLGDLGRDQYDTPGEGCAVFRQRSAKEARRAAAASIEGLAEWLVADESHKVVLTAIPASSWKPTPVVVVKAEPTLSV